MLNIRVMFVVLGEVWFAESVSFEFMPKQIIRLINTQFGMLCIAIFWSSQKPLGINLAVSIMAWPS